VPHAPKSWSHGTLVSGTKCTKDDSRVCACGTTWQDRNRTKPTTVDGIDFFGVPVALFIAVIFHHDLVNDVGHRTSHGKHKAAAHNCDTRAAPYHMGPEALRRSLDRTHRWELRSLKEHLVAPNDQAMYCVCGRQPHVTWMHPNVFCNLAGWFGGDAERERGRAVKESVLAWRLTST
jgi:hypothetical protein